MVITGNWLSTTVRLWLSYDGCWGRMASDELIVRGSHVAGRSAARPADVHHPVWQRRAVSGLSVPTALAGGVPLPGLWPRPSLRARAAQHLRVHELRPAALAAQGHDLRADQDRPGQVVPGDLPRDLEQGRDRRHRAAAADGLRQLPDGVGVVAQDPQGD